MRSREGAETSRVRPDRFRVRSGHGKRRNAARIPVLLAVRPGPNRRQVATRGPRTMSGQVGIPRLDARDPLVPKWSGRRPTRAIARRKPALSPVEYARARTRARLSPHEDRIASAELSVELVPAI